MQLLCKKKSMLSGHPTCSRNCNDFIFIPETAMNLASTPKTVMNSVSTLETAMTSVSTPESAMTLVSDVKQEDEDWIDIICKVEDNGPRRIDASSANKEPCICSFCGLQFLNERILMMHLQFVHPRVTGFMHEVKDARAHDQEFPSADGRIRDSTSNAGVAAGCSLDVDKTQPASCASFMKTEYAEGQSDNVTHKQFKESPPFRCGLGVKNVVSVLNNSNITKVGTQTGKYPYKCTVCGKNCVDSSYFLLHMRIHTGEKPYTCGLCGKDFARAYSIKVHMKTHTGEKPYQCSICKKFLTTARNRDRHMDRLHSQETPYS